jgi:hypothetical protein
MGLQLRRSAFRRSRGAPQPKAYNLGHVYLPSPCGTPAHRDSVILASSPGSQCNFMQSSIFWSFAYLSHMHLR